MPRQKQFAKPHHFEEIAHVTTVPVVCKLFHVTPPSVMNGINTDRIAAVKEGGVWLISFNSALEYFRPGVLSESK